MKVIPDFEFDVFLSHNSQDKPLVRILAKQLVRAGVRVWYDEWQIRAGDDIYLAIERGLEVSRVQCLCLSKEALESDWVSLERSTVLFRDPSNKGRRFVPLLIEDCELPDSLRRYKYIDYRQQSTEAFEELLSTCRIDAHPFEDDNGSGRQRFVPKRTLSTIQSPVQPKDDSHPERPSIVLERSMAGHTGSVFGIAISPDGSWAASASRDKTVRLWGMDDGEYMAKLEGHTAQVNAVAISRDGTRIISVSDDRSVRVWERRSRREVSCFWGHTFNVRAVLAMPDERILTGAVGDDSTMRIWDLVTQQCVAEIQAKQTVMCAASDPLGNRVVIGGHEGMVAVWNIHEEKRIAVLEGHTKGSTISGVAVSKDGQIAVTGSDDRTLRIWDLNRGVCVGTLEGHTGSVARVAISPDGGLIASTGSIDRTIRLWDRQTGSCLQVLHQRWSGFGPLSIEFSPDGKRVAAGAVDHEGRIYLYSVSGTRQATASEPTRRYINAKVVLLGEGTVGKTSLAHRLVQDKYVIEDRTHGMNVWPLSLPLGNDPNVEREALLWDLAGQEDYRLIHRLFLYETAIALFLVNPQKIDPLLELGDWIRSLDAAARNGSVSKDAARLLVFSQVDVGGAKIGSASIDRIVRENHFSGWLTTSAKTGENCSDGKNAGKPSRLKQLIADHIPWKALPWTTAPRLLAELKHAVLLMRDTTDIRLLRLGELSQRLAQSLPGEGFGEAEVRTAVTLLSNHGLVRLLNFGELVLLQPELLNGYASAIIRAARAHSDELGSVFEADIYDANFDFTGVARLHRADEELMLRAMVQSLIDHSLCIAEETPQGRQLVFPSQFRREREIPFPPEVIVSYSFGGEWQTIWSTLVVRLWYSQEFERRELWRNAAEFASSRGYSMGLKIENRQGSGEATVGLFFGKNTPNELRIMLMEYVHRHLERYGCDVNRERRYVCGSCAKAVVDHELVRDFLAEGRAYIECQRCRGKIELVDQIERHLKSDPVSRKITNMERVTESQLGAQSLEQMLIGHLQAVAGEANQTFRLVSMPDIGVDGEIEFVDDQGAPSGKKVLIQFNLGGFYTSSFHSNGSPITKRTEAKSLKLVMEAPFDVFLVVRCSDEQSEHPGIRWMNVSQKLRSQEDRSASDIIFDGELITMETIWKIRDQMFPR